MAKFNLGNGNDRFTGTPFDDEIYGNGGADTITTGAANEDATVNGKAISQWSASIPYTIPATGARTLLLRFKPNAANGFAVVGNQASLNVIVVFG